jgi:hypothetical protein
MFSSADSISAVVDTWDAHKFAEHMQDLFDRNPAWADYSCEMLTR